MDIATVMEACPNLERVLRAKEGRIARVIDNALRELVDDIHAADKDAGAVRKVKLVLSVRPDADRSSARVEIDDPTVTLAKRPVECVQVHIGDGVEGGQMFAAGLDQAPIGRTGGLTVE